MLVFFFNIDVKHNLTYAIHVLLFQYCGRTDRFLGASTDPAFILPDTQFSLHIRSSYYVNHPPTLLTPLVTTFTNEPLQYQLKYFDRENDFVQFSLQGEPLHGKANVTWDGLLKYEPDAYFSGTDELVVRMTEFGLPSG